MRTLTGTYYNGELSLDFPLITEKPIKVIISYNEEEKSPLSLSDFSFAETQELLKDCTSSFADEVIEDRRNAL